MVRVADTSALYAFVVEIDRLHARALKAFADPEPIVAPSEALVETIDLIGRRFDARAARDALHSILGLPQVTVAEQVQIRAVRAVFEANPRLSLADAYGVQTRVRPRHPEGREGLRGGTLFCRGQNNHRMRWDCAVVGAGVVGLCVARALALRGARVLVFEAEPGLARHQSGRNSGVVHAGFNCRPGSLKARLCVEGSRALRRYAQERGVPWAQVGKVVVARSEPEVAVLETLLAQGRANGVEGLRLVDAEELRQLEPHVAGLAALHSPGTAVVASARLVEALAEEARGLGAELRLAEPLLRAEHRGRWRLRTRGGWHEAERLVTCAGLQSDRVARRCGARHPYVVVPFRGSYRRLRPGREGLVRGLVYPAPDLRFPFLGLHLTKQVDGSVLAGPSALLALGREAYGHWLEAEARDVGSMLARGGFWRLLLRPGFLGQARRELARAASPHGFARDAQALVPALRPGDLLPGPSGIRAQLVDPRGTLVDDLVLLERERAVHVLNAVSPALTSSLALGEHVAERALAG